MPDKVTELKFSGEKNHLCITLYLVGIDHVFEAALSFSWHVCFLGPVKLQEISTF